MTRTLQSLYKKENGRAKIYSETPMDLVPVDSVTSPSFTVNPEPSL